MKINKTSCSLYRRKFGILHGPGPVLLEHSSWRTWNGVYITIRNTTYWIEVR